MRESLRYRPYDLEVVPRQMVDNEYFTMSATGVMRIKRSIQVGCRGGAGGRA